SDTSDWHATDERGHIIECECENYEEAAKLDRRENSQCTRRRLCESGDCMNYCIAAPRTTSDSSTSTSSTVDTSGNIPDDVNECYKFNGNTAIFKSMGSSPKVKLSVSGIQRTGSSSLSGMSDIGSAEGEIVLTSSNPSSYGVRATGLRNDDRITISNIASEGTEITFEVDTTGLPETEQTTPSLVIETLPMNLVTTTTTVVSGGRNNRNLPNCGSDSDANFCVNDRARDRVVITPRSNEIARYTISSLTSTSNPCADLTSGSSCTTDDITGTCWEPNIAGAGLECYSECRQNHVMNNRGSFNSRDIPDESGFCIPEENPDCQDDEMPTTFGCSTGKVCCFNGRGVTRSLPETSSTGRSSRGGTTRGTTTPTAVESELSAGSAGEACGNPGQRGEGYVCATSGSPTCTRTIPRPLLEVQCQYGLDCCLPMGVVPEGGECGNLPEPVGVAECRSSCGVNEVNYLPGQPACSGSLTCCAQRIECENSRNFPDVHNFNSAISGTTIYSVKQSSSGITTDCGLNRYCIPYITDNPGSTNYGSCFAAFSAPFNNNYCSRLDTSLCQSGCNKPALSFVEDCPEYKLPYACWEQNWWDPYNVDSRVPYDLYYREHNKQTKCANPVTGDPRTDTGIDCGANEVVKRGGNECLTINSPEFWRSVCHYWRGHYRIMLPSTREEICNICDANSVSLMADGVTQSWSCESG
ncbi:hypothetical protein HQ545_02465, partial [Candidatus Woesearchaeota archaeon]|nr:hypothetical protein [Candidatus Woesearchaeota archaeon]